MSLLTPIAINPDTPPFDLNHARIMYNSVLSGSASFTTGGVNPSFPLIPNTTGNYTVTAYYRATSGGTLIAFDTITPTNNNAIMFHIPNSVSARVIEIHTSSGSGAAFIGSIYAGIAMQMQRPFLGGHTPAVLAS